MVFSGVTTQLQNVGEGLAHLLKVGVIILEAQWCWLKSYNLIDPVIGYWFLFVRSELGNEKAELPYSHQTPD